MAPSKADKTREFILETVAPVFNQQGYVATSFGVLEKATGLSKGAMYGNFKNKEALALAAFNYSIKKIMRPLNEKVRQETSGLAKLRVMVTYYRTYYEDYMKDAGGCAVLNVGVDAHYHHPALFKRTQEIIHKLEQGICNMIEQAKAEKSLRPDLDSQRLAKLVYSMIEGAVFMVSTTQNPDYLPNMMDHIDEMITRDWMA
ncbi:MAG: TetR/AcrR family transcriptional regulator [Bacteroidota bacterium]